MSTKKSLRRGKKVSSPESAEKPDLIEDSEVLPELSKFEGVMDGLSGSLTEKVAEVLAAEPDKPLVDENSIPSTRGPAGNSDYVKPGSLKHLVFLGFDEYGNYLSDLNHLTEEQAKNFIATRLRWWYAARSAGDEIIFPAGTPPAHNFSMDPDVEEYVPV